MIFIDYDPVGKTLNEVLNDGNSVFIYGISVFALQNDSDTTGMIEAQEFSLRKILRDHPELRTARVVSHNDFFGESVFRVRKENCIESETN